MIKFWLLRLSVAHKIAAFTALCVLLCGLFLSLATVQGNHALAEQSLHLLGENLSAQLADSSTAALVEGDKLSLQAQLESLMKNPLVAAATVYDIANQPIVEAGDNRNGVGFSAAITYHDSIAGYALITLDATLLKKQASLLGWQLAGLSFLLSGLCYLLTLQAGRWLAELSLQLASIVRASNYPNNTLGLPVLYRGDDELGQLVRQIIKGPNKATARSESGLVVLLLQANNAEQNELEHFYPALRKISKLYTGDLQLSGSHAFSLAFSQSDDKDSYLFRALCCAYLVNGLAQDALEHHSISLAFNDNASSLFAKEELLEQAAKITASRISANIRLFEHDSVKQRCEFNTTDGDAWLTGFKPPYDAMLERQLSTLRQQLAARQS